MGPEFMKILEGSGNIVNRLKSTDLTSYDFMSMEVQVNTVWIIKLNYMGLVDASKRVLHTTTEDKRPGARPYFSLTCTAMWQRDGPERVTRWMDEYAGLPDSAAVLDFIRHAIATPFPPMRPCIPEGMYFELNLAPHGPALRPFLNSLRAPFKWIIESPAIAEWHSEVAMAGKEDRLAAYAALARKTKEAGNAAFAKRDRDGAVELYKEAIEHAVRAATEGASEESMKREQVYRLLAICASNCAAAYLLEGDGMDAQKALESAQEAEEFDKSYVKGYQRQARAHEILGDLDKAIDVMERARACPDVTENMKSGIESRLAELQLNRASASEK
ncbi:hypothetical protein BV25DRAFT_1879765 [Artomyces pyxidatus]|uniref:Uncharacterized protein n=1 Tax=Artomyces pyxidatus TaxID=48021 RepID=A0ACB8TCC3_9AGAM|nr:hypothetical protein BV25DRAFT_1879765 [Artomyces pyxidatus]